MNPSMNNREGGGIDNVTCFSPTGLGCFGSEGKEVSLLYVCKYSSAISL